MVPLASSREPLRVAGEARYRLAPLALPDPDDLAGAARCESVVLFADRARDADAHFVLDEAAGPGVAQLLDHLDDRFDLLATGDRLAAGRQRSLAATVEWSYQLLDEREQRVFHAVSVFPGPPGDGDGERPGLSSGACRQRGMAGLSYVGSRRHTICFP